MKKYIALISIACLLVCAQAAMAKYIREPGNSSYAQTALKWTNASNIYQSQHGANMHISEIWAVVYDTKDHLIGFAAKFVGKGYPTVCSILIIGAKQEKHPNGYVAGGVNIVCPTSIKDPVVPKSSIQLSA